MGEVEPPGLSTSTWCDGVGLGVGFLRKLPLIQAGHFYHLFGMQLLGCHYRSLSPADTFSSTCAWASSRTLICFVIGCYLFYRSQIAFAAPSIINRHPSFIVTSHPL